MTRTTRPAVLTALALLAALALAACGAAGPLPPSASPSAAPSPASGIEGRTEASPTCPVARPGATCPPKAISATVAVLDGAGHEVTRFTSAGDGTFHVALRPGAYTLAQPPGRPRTPPTLRPVAVTVSAGQYTTLVLEFDTGIR